MAPEWSVMPETNINIPLLIVGGAVILVAIIYFAATYKRRKDRTLSARVLSSFGAVPKREYTQEELEKIAKYQEIVHEEGVFSIDDITWNDLHMDTAFAQMNHTFSSMGEEELYRILREPLMEPEALQERKRVIHWFEENEYARTEFQKEYVKIGRTRKVSLAETLQDFDKLNLKPDAVYLIPLALILAAVAVTIFFPTAGIMAIIAAVIMNLVLYYKVKAILGAYYTSLAAVSHAVRSGERILKVSAPAGLEAYLSELEDALKPLKAIKRDDRFLGASMSTVVSSNPLHIIMDYLRMMTHLDFIAFNHMVKVVVREHDSILRTVHILGYLEAMISIASYRQTLPFYTEGEVGAGERGQMPSLNAKDLYHPLLSNPVANSIHTERPVLITGSNASGKSTFLRTTAFAALMAQTTCTVCANEYEAPAFRLFSSMALSDSMETGESYYVVEIRSIKRVLDQSRAEGAPVLVFVDEVLRGTNTVERIAASSQILKDLAERKVLVFAATHDVELTSLLSGYYMNKHFDEEILDGEVRFSYILKDGRATTRNAIRLLSVMGYDEEIIDRAEETAEHFSKDNEWVLY
jgi:DNA mismatch repair ATPase MutS